MSDIRTGPMSREEWDKIKGPSVNPPALAPDDPMLGPDWAKHGVQSAGWLEKVDKVSAGMDRDELLKLARHMALQADAAAQQYQAMLMAHQEVAALTHYITGNVPQDLLVEARKTAPAIVAHNGIANVAAALIERLVQDRSKAKEKSKSRLLSWFFPGLE